MHFDKEHCLVWRLQILDSELKEMTVKQDKPFSSLKHPSTLAYILVVSLGMRNDRGH